ncbi:MAG: radical SAM protein [Lentisphaerae bacterium]|nr:radical SAM protein [Lentisphaerota bacterium]
MNNPCTQCPRRCNIIRSAEYIADGKLPGVCHAPALPVVARAGLHHWEEPVISGERGSGTVFFSGCNLNCVYCQNYNISSKVEGKLISLERLRAIYRELIDSGAHNINLVTPTHYSQVICESLTPQLPVPVVYNTNGYDSVEMLKKFDSKVQIYLTDYKYADNNLGLRYSGVGDYAEQAWDAIEEMYRQTGPYVIDDNGIMQKGVIIRHLILPNAVENTLQVIKKVAERFQPGEILFSLMRQYLPCGKVSAAEYSEINRTVTDEEYEIIEEALYTSGIEDGFVQDGSSASDDFIPCFDGSGV